LRIVCAKLDRLSRSEFHLHQLRESRVDFECVDLGPGVDPVMLSLQGMFAEQERRKISERTKAALAAKRARGEPLGNMENLRLHAHKGNEVMAQRARDEIEPFRLVLTEYVGRPYREIARELNARMVKTPRGGEWESKQVSRAMRRLELL
jgi:DNA invertase Pin-like site-specific DNA recombinase